MPDKRLVNGLANVPAQPPIRKAPTTVSLSTDQNENAQTQENTNAIAQNSDSAIVRKSDNAKEQPARVSRGYKLREDLIKSLKRIALEDDRLLYEVMEEALEEYIKKRTEQPSA